MKFDQAYYERFYENPDTRATSPAEQQRQADFVASYLKYLEMPLERIVDFGCGMGELLRGLGQAFPGASVTGVEVSQYLCDELGWENGSVVDYEDDPFDLVLCTDVLAYLSDADCAAAIDNIARLTTSAAYISVLTAEDEDICDTQHTDMRQQLRSHTWYRKRLNKHFVSAGGGLFLKKPLTVAVWQLERGV